MTLSTPLVLVLVMVVLFSIGVYLMLDRSLTRVLLGFLLVGNATNLLIFLTSGAFGSAPIYGEAEPVDMSDPLPQAFILTAIVITFGVSAFMLALIYRSWRLAREDEDAVLDDAHDIELVEADVLTTEEVTDEELERSQEFADDADDVEMSDSVDADSATMNNSSEGKTGTRDNSVGTDESEVKR